MCTGYENCKYTEKEMYFLSYHQTILSYQLFVLNCISMNENAVINQIKHFLASYSLFIDMGMYRCSKFCDRSFIYNVD